MKKIGTVVNKLGIPASTIRYYEKVGLIRPLARVSNSRYFVDEDIDQLKFIQMAQQVGFSIEEIKELLSALSIKSIEQDKCVQLVKVKIAELDEKINDLQRMKKSLSKAVDCHCPSIKSCVEYSEHSTQCFGELEG